MYAETNQSAITDHDEYHYQNRKIGAILEASGMKTFYQFDTDWFYREHQRRWINKSDRWMVMERTFDGSIVKSVLHP